MNNKFSICGKDVTADCFGQKIVCEQGENVDQIKLGFEGTNEAKTGVSYEKGVIEVIAGLWKLNPVLFVDLKDSDIVLSGLKLESGTVNVGIKKCTGKDVEVDKVSSFSSLLDLDEIALNGTDSLVLKKGGTDVTKIRLADWKVFGGDCANLEKFFGDRRFSVGSPLAVDFGNGTDVSLGGKVNKGIFAVDGNDSTVEFFKGLDVLVKGGFCTVKGLELKKADGTSAFDETVGGLKIGEVVFAVGGHFNEDVAIDVVLGEMEGIAKYVNGGVTFEKVGSDVKKLKVIFNEKSCDVVLVKSA